MKRGWRGVETHELAADEAVVVVAAPPLSWFITCVSHVNCVRPIVLLVLVLLFSLSWRLCSGPARISIVLIVPIECFWLLGCFIVFPSGEDFALGFPRVNSVDCVHQIVPLLLRIIIFPAIDVRSGFAREDGKGCLPQGGGGRR